MQPLAWIGAICIVLPAFVTVCECSWGSPGTGQYHIQTDEGPERYFRFQTDNGQFRKEKRLQDGTVIGTEAWIDAAGFLRQKDYIADKKGYRILKSKTVYVGEGRQIEDAIKSTKSVPAQSGVLVDGSNGLRSLKTGYEYGPHSSTARPVVVSTTTTTPAPVELPPRLGYLSPAEAAKLEKSPYLGFDHYPDELPTRFPARHHHYDHDHDHDRHQPIVYVRPHSEPIDDPASNSIGDDYLEAPAAHPQHYGRLSSTSTTTTTTERPFPAIPQPSLDMLPPATTHYRRLRPIAIASTTPAPISGNLAYGQRVSSTPAPFVSVTPSPTPGYHYSTPSPTEAPYADHHAPLTAYDVNSLNGDGGLLPPLRPNQYRRLRPRPLQRPGNDLEAPYDGVSVTQNGYRYVLPHQYHEDEQVDASGKRAGSFGYVDPFGIRRVVYYNASPERGFVHRNNNRYVGVGAAPYDPPV